ncbi:sodium/potassium-transporting ATPase subunit beta-233-like, partial [Salvelinus sp. IW2-2015]
LSHTPRSDKSEIAFNLNDVETYLAYTKAMRSSWLLFIGTIQALLLTLITTKPPGKTELLPRPTHTPRSDKSEIAFNLNDVETYLAYTKAMREFLVMYDDDKQRDQMKYEDCGGGIGTKCRDMEWNCVLTSSEKSNRMTIRTVATWRVMWGSGRPVASRELLGPCSGMDDRDFGFKEGKPCLIVKLNRIVNFRPRPPSSNESIPEGAQTKVQPNVMPIFCTNKREEDAGKIGEVKYYGIGEGFPLQYYPYYGKLLHPQYLQPLVALQFVNLTMNTELRIECRAYGENIGYSEKDKFQGKFDVKFTVTNL